jgi:hypothetical protein
MVITVAMVTCLICEVRAEAKEKVEQQAWSPHLTVVSSGKYVLWGEEKAEHPASPT